METVFGFPGIHPLVTMPIFLLLYWSIDYILRYSTRCLWRKNQLHMFIYAFLDYILYDNMINIYQVGQQVFITEAQLLPA